MALDTKIKHARSASTDEFRRDPERVIGLAFEHGEVTIKGDRPEDRIRFVTQTTDLSVK